MVKNVSGNRKQLKTGMLRIAAAVMALLLFVCIPAYASTGLPAVGSKTFPEELSSGGFAVLDIRLDGYPEDAIMHDDWSRITYSLYYDGKSLKNESAQIKGRGNYTWYQPKKPYAVKCDKKTDWFGFGASRDWILLANITDQTNMRNLIALTLASKFDFIFTPECRPAHVFIDGRYNGLYLITEKVEIGKERVDIDYRSGDVLIELDNNYGGGEPDAFGSFMGNLYVPKDPSREEYDALPENELSYDQILKNAKDKINNFEKAITSLKGFDEYSKYMDLQSLADWYIFNEIMKNDDTLFNSSIYLWNDYDGLLHMGPVWDYDLSMGGIDRNEGKNVDPEGFMFAENYWGRPNWMEFVLTSTRFNNMVRARWQELYYSGVFESIISLFEVQREYLREAYDYNYSRWGNDGVFVRSASYDDSVDNLKSFFVRRIEWLNSQWNDSDVTPEPVELTPIPTSAPERTKPPVTADTNPTAAPDITPEPTQHGPASEKPYDEPEEDGNQWLYYVLLFVGVCAGTVFLSLTGYLIYMSKKKK